jgi:CRP/FNR family transcriptional regulator, cyclic AMP receptor protein
METLEPLLLSHPFFKDLDLSYIKMLVGCATVKVFPPGAFLTRAGEEANAFFLIRQGLVSIETSTDGGDPIILQTADNGDIIGWSWLVPPYFWHFDARAEVETRVFVLDGVCIRKQCEANPALGCELLKRFARIMERRLEATRLQLLDVYRTR